MTAVELLRRYSGPSAAQFEPCFRYSKKARIDSVTIYAVGTEGTTARYSGHGGDWKEVNNILRITTADGFEAISGVDSYYEGRFSDEHLVELEFVAADLVALESLDPVDVGATLKRMRPKLSDPVRSSIDIALWDLAARKADRPLYKLLGAKRVSIVPYASLPFYDSLPEYVEAVHEYAKLGYKTFKFHVWGSIDKDIQLIELIQEKFANSEYRFMMDLEAAYDLEDSIRLGRCMDNGFFVWLEEPMHDELLAQYAELRSELATEIIPGGYSVYSPEFLRQGIEAGAWDAARFDTTTVGGISTALQLLEIANDAGVRVEIQSWGHSLTQAVNLHLMLANQGTRYFEAPMPKQAFEFGSKNGNLLDRGRIVAPDRPGLGIDVDWERLSLADFYVCSSR